MADTPSKALLGPGDLSRRFRETVTQALHEFETKAREAAAQDSVQISLLREENACLLSQLSNLRQQLQHIQQGSSTIKSTPTPSASPPAASPSAPVTPLAHNSAIALDNAKAELSALRKLLHERDEALQAAAAELAALRIAAEQEIAGLRNAVIERDDALRSAATEIDELRKTVGESNGLMERHEVLVKAHGELKTKYESKAAKWRAFNEKFKMTKAAKEQQSHPQQPHAPQQPPSRKAHQNQQQHQSQQLPQGSPAKRRRTGSSVDDDAEEEEEKEEKEERAVIPPTQLPRPSSAVLTATIAAAAAATTTATTTATAVSTHSDAPGEMAAVTRDSVPTNAASKSVDEQASQQPQQARIPTATLAERRASSADTVAPIVNALPSASMLTRKSSMPEMIPPEHLPHPPQQPPPSQQQHPPQPIKYAHVERRQAERRNMHAVDCPCCKDYFQMTTDIPRVGGSIAANKSLSKQSKQQHQQQQQQRQNGSSTDNGGAGTGQAAVGRHRFKYIPPQTPEGYWDLGMMSSSQGHVPEDEHVAL